MSSAPTLASALALSDEPRMVSCATQPHCPIVHTNRAFADMWGFTFLDVVNKPSISFLNGGSSETNASAVQALQCAFAELASPCTASLLTFRKDGTPFISHLHCALVGNDSHWLITIAAEPITPGSVADVQRPAESPRMPLMPVSYAELANYAGAHERVKRAPSASKLRLHDVLNNSTDPTVICSATYPHQIVHPNQPWLEMCGFTLEEVEGLTNKVLTGPETDPEGIARLLDCVRRSEPSVQTLVNYKKGGTRFINQVCTVPVYDEHDEVAAFASMLHEVRQSHIGAGADSAGTGHLWSALGARLDANGGRLGGGANGAARAEAARKLIGNHAAVLADVTSRTPPPSQPSLECVPAAVAGYVDDALRMIARRLILGSDDADGGRDGPALRGCPCPELSKTHPSWHAQQVAWAQTAAFLDARIQTDAHASGRAPDMSKDAAAAMRRVLHDLSVASADPIAAAQR